MIFNDVVNELMHGEKIFNLPFRVVYYARVSTDSDVQLNSLDNQLNYYENYIKAKPAWTYVGGYVEEGVTGVTVDKRNSFKTMIRDAKNHKFDLIITKEVSRFARDLEDSIHYIRELKAANVGIFFENQNLNTFDPNSELILNIMFNLAQDESRKLSSRVKFGHREAIKKGHVLGSSNIIGYKKDKCKLVVVEQEAEFVCKVFELYATGVYGFYKLSKKLGTLGYFNKNGNLYDKDTLKRIIENPKYKGYYRAKVYEVIDYRSKKRQKNNIEKQIIYKCEDGSVPKIVSEELWDQANKILNRRQKGYNDKTYSGGLKYPFSSKIYCKQHNSSFQRSQGSKKKDRPVWVCSKYLQYRLEACLSPIIAEVDLLNILEHIINIIVPNQKKITDELINLYQNNYQNNYDSNISLIENKIKKIEEKKSFALELVFNKELSKDSLKQQFIKFERELAGLYQQKEEALKRITLINNHVNYAKNHFSIINSELKTNILSSCIREFVDEIIVSKIDGERHNIKLDIFLNPLGDKKFQIKGARHINGPLDEEVLYLENEKYETLEVERKVKQTNKFTYNVYVKSPTC